MEPQSRVFHLALSVVTWILFFTLGQAQTTRPGVIRGTVTTGDTPLEYATVQVLGTRFHATTNEKGEFLLRAPEGTHTIKVEYLGYRTYEKKIELKSEEKHILHIKLKEEASNLSEVVVEAKSPVQRINESAFNVVAIHTKELYNSGMDIADALDRISGVKIRYEGGVGSSTQINLNGFTGKYVEIFMDGVPMGKMGSSFRINNIPVNMAERIEVYKGVVPVEFGSDAPGGVINIVTGKSRNTFVDASYSFGSFNTHKSNLTVGHTTKKGFTVQINGFQNYSDNDYKVKTIYLEDVASGLYSTEEKWFRRFHDRYHNEAVMGKVGFVNKSWANHLLVGLTYSRESAQVQNANLMEIVFGGKKRKSTTLSPSLDYEKRNLLVENLNFSLSARYDHSKNNNIDTIPYRYSWTGESYYTGTKGEADNTLAEYKGKTGYVSANLNYSLLDKHIFTLHNNYSQYTQSSTNSAANLNNSTGATFMKRKNEKNILGLAYQLQPNQRWNIQAFAKYYHTHVTGPVNVSGTSTSRYELYSKSKDAIGYGAAGTFFFAPETQLKSSLEKTYRLPTERELFGDGDLEQGNADVKPENSLNFNLSLSHTFHINARHAFLVDAGFAYRHIQDYILRQIGNKGTGQSRNHGDVVNRGGEFTARYFYKKMVVIGGNLTYQDMRNKEKLNEIQAQSVTYNDRIPNVPYLFANGDASLNLSNVLHRGNTLHVGYNLQYVHKYYKSWQGDGSKYTIPQQLAHDLSVGYSIQDGRYNITFEAKNITDELLYDNYKLQKPGRNFLVKFRYFFMQSNKL